MILIVITYIDFAQTVQTESNLFQFFFPILGQDSDERQRGSRRKCIL